MRPLKGMVWGCALAALAAGGGPAHAAWNNVFQVCCSSCGGPAPAPAAAYYAGPAVAAYADPGAGGGCCPTPCPQPCPPPCPPPPVCTTRYVQRCYYQPVTSYRTSTYYQPVTTYRTSFYYEPCTSYRYSCYYDPCTCRYQQVAQPVTSYSLRSRCCPVTSYLQRTCCTPVTTYQQSFYYEPVTSCCTSGAGAVAAPPPPPPGGPIAPVPAVPGPAPATAESVTPPPPPPMVGESRDGGSPPTSRKLDRNPGVMPRAADSSYRGPAAAPPAVRFDRIASLSGHNLEGKVVDAGQTPRAGVRVLFVSVEGKTIQHTTTANDKGAFRVRLNAGGWLVYTYDESGRPVFSRRIEVSSNRAVTMTLVKR